MTGGLYRDDVLFAMLGLTRTHLNELRKDLGNFIKDFFCLNIVFDVNTKVANFLHVTLDLITDLYCPFCKLNKSILYINIMSNYPKHVLQGIIKTISIRVSNLSANENMFNKHASLYDNASWLSGFKVGIQFINTHQEQFG